MRAENLPKFNHSLLHLLTHTHTGANTHSDTNTCSSVLLRFTMATSRIAFQLASRVTGLISCEPFGVFQQDNVPTLFAVWTVPLPPHGHQTSKHDDQCCPLWCHLISEFITRMVLSNEWAAIIYNFYITDSTHTDCCLELYKDRHNDTTDACNTATSQFMLVGKFY